MNFNGANEVQRAILNYAKFIKNVKKCIACYLSTGFSGYTNGGLSAHMHGKRAKMRKSDSKLQRCGEKLIQVFSYYYVRCTQFICTSTACKPQHICELEFAICKVTHTHTQTHKKSYAKLLESTYYYKFIEFSGNFE